ncbi:MAG: asparagine synthase (glutamine-hydrolyzing) [Firmicutes bacterium]|nr:asparagine synthase (glutamine-hydrolyzing) [Bacillota bacterium]
MCGICGFSSLPGADAAMLARMTSAMAHRGPDDEGAWLGEDGVGLGVRRLAVIDPGGSPQPLANEDGSVQVVVNGEIYNYRELRRELEGRGHRLATGGDGEVIAHLYEDLGPDVVARLRGMFAFALYDRRRATLLLARDPFGIKPLFWAEGRSGGVLFASDVGSILASGAVSPRVRGAALWDYLTFQYVPGPDTLLARVHRLPPGHRATVREGEVRIEAYEHLRFAPDDTLPFAEAKVQVRRALEEAVTSHLASDVPVGAFLSSGVDSSALVSLARRRGELDTFSIAFEGARPHADEAPAARALAAALGTRHHEVRVDARAYADAWPAIVRAMEDPVADPSAPGIYFLSREARRAGVKVVLSGEGADELFGGYPVYRQPHDLRWVSRLPPAWRRSLVAAARCLPAGRRGRNYVERAATPLERRYVGGARILEEGEKAALAGPLLWADEGRQASCERAAPWYAAVHADRLDEPTRMQAVDLAGWLPGDILAKADKMSMAHGVEVRVPYLDRGMWEVARQLPTRHKLGGGTTKRVLRAAVADLLPEEVRRRPKLGFPVPLRDWLRGPLDAYVREVVADHWPEGWLDRAAFERMMEENRLGRADRARAIYTVVNFVLWHRIFVTGKEG